MLKRILFGLVFHLISQHVNGQTQLCRSYGGPADDKAYALVEASDGGYVMAGQTNSYGTANSDVYVVKINTLGDIQWTRTVGGSGNDYAFSMAATTDGGYILGGHTDSYTAGGDDFYFIKLDVNGNVEWTKVIGGTDDDRGFEVVQTTDGGYAMAGQTASFGAGTQDFYVVKLDGSGNLLWEKRYGNGSIADIAYSLTATSDGGLAVCGTSFFFIAGNLPASTVEYYIIKLDSDGAIQWTRLIRDPNAPNFYPDYARCIIQTSDGGYMVSGEAGRKKNSGGYVPKIFLVKLDGSGNVSWTNYYGANAIPGVSAENSDYGEAVIQTSDGGYVVAGYTFSFNYNFGTAQNVGLELYLIKVDGSGNLLWTRVVGGVDHQIGKAIVATSDGGFAVAGYQQPAVAGNGSEDFYFMKMDASLENCCDTRSGGAALGTAATNTTRGSEFSANGIESVGGISSTGGVMNDFCQQTLQVTITPTHVRCKGACNGSALANTVGGTPPYTYTWTSGSTVALANLLCAGTYKVFVEDNAGARDTAEITITEPATKLVGNVIINNHALCNASCDGKATASAQDGSPGYTFQWDTEPVQNTTDVSNLCVGTYSCIVTDNNGCKDTLEVVITEPMPLEADTSTTAATCGNSDGSASLNNTSGGTGPYTYSWNSNPPQTGATATNLPAGSYTATITDSRSCTRAINLIVPSLGGGSASIEETENARCFGQANGSLKAKITGGTPPFTYSWNSTPSQTAAQAVNLRAGTYTCTITDGTNCITTVNGTVGEPDSLLVSITKVQPGCGQNNGTLTMNIIGGGTPPFTFSWNTSPVQASATATNLAPGEYTCTISDANGCTRQFSDSLQVPAPLQVEIEHIPACGPNSGATSVTLSGGTAPYQYSWSPNGETTPNLQGVQAGSYAVNVQDAKGCSGTDTVQIQTLTVPLVDAGENQEINIGESVVLNGEGSTGIYSWDPTNHLSCSDCLQPMASPLQTTTYTLSITAPNGCTASDTVQVLVNIICGEVFVPNAFSPNTDGENDQLCVYGNCFKTLRFMVFDRWGEKVFDSDSTKPCWDGTFRNKTMNSAVFGFYLEGTLFTGEEIKRKGEINLIR